MRSRLKRFFRIGLKCSLRPVIIDKRSTMRIGLTIAVVASLACVNCFIIPEELPSLLSLIYSNIPPVKKGTDSRIGLGFRLGPHADFQVLLELGPQTHTDPLSSVTADDPAKREILVMKNPQTLVNYVNGIRDYFSPDKKKEKLPDTVGGKWIDWWRQNILTQDEIGKIKFKKVPGIDDLSAEGSEAVIVMEKDPTNYKNSVVDHLRQLYKERPQKS